MLVFLMLGQHLQFANGHHHVAVGGDVGEHVFVANAGVHATAVAEDEDGEFLFLGFARAKQGGSAYGHGCIEVDRTIDNEVGQGLLAHGDGLVASATTEVGHFHLLEAHAGVVVLEVASIEGIHGGTCEFQLLVEGNAVLTMHFHIVHL